MVAILDYAREVGLNLLNNAKNSMIEKFHSIKWLFHEIEELKEKRSQEEGQRRSSDQGSIADQMDHISKVEKRVQRMEISNQKISNELIATLNILNNNINSLGESLKNMGICAIKDERGNEESRWIEGKMNVTKGPVECATDLN